MRFYLLKTRVPDTVAERLRQDFAAAGIPHHLGEIIVMPGRLPTEVLVELMYLPGISDLVGHLDYVELFEPTLEPLTDEMVEAARVYVRIKGP